VEIIGVALRRWMGKHQLFQCAGTFRYTNRPRVSWWQR